MLRCLELAPADRPSAAEVASRLDDLLDALRLSHTGEAVYAPPPPAEDPPPLPATAAGASCLQPAAALLERPAATDTDPPPLPATAATAAGADGPAAGL